MIDFGQDLEPILRDSVVEKMLHEPVGRSVFGAFLEEMMTKLLSGLVLAAALTGILPFAARAQQQPAPEQTCLQNNRIWSWNAVSDRLLIVTDRSYRRYIVRLGGGCINLSAYPLTALSFHTWTELGCLQRGDTVVYNAPALGRLNCFVNDVEPYSDQLLAEAENSK